MLDVELARDPETGKRRRVSRTIEGTREDAALALASLRVTAAQRRTPIGPARRRSVQTALNLYLKDAQSGKIELAPKTIVTSKSAMKTMCDQSMPTGSRFGDILLSRLTWENIEDMYASMKRNGLGSDWIRRCATVLSRALDYARKRGLIDANPSRDAVRPRTVRNKPYSPSRDEIDALSKAVRDSADQEIADAVEIVIGTGLRVGELLGLHVGDIHLGAMEMHVAWAVSDGGPGVGVIRKPTKKSDWRDVPLTLSVKDAIEMQLNRRRERLGRNSTLDGYLFAGDLHGAKPVRPDDLADRLAIARGGSRVTFLDLRHYVATKMLDAEVPYRTVADLLGNSEATLRLHYDGRTDTGKRAAIGALERASVESPEQRTIVSNGEPFLSASKARG